MTNKTLNLQPKSAVSIALAAVLLMGYMIQPAFAQKKIVWYSMQKAQILAEKNNKKVLIYAGADWCVYCKKMDQQVFPDQRVIDSLTTYFYGVRLDIASKRSIIFNGKRTTPYKFARTHKVRATPTFFFLNSNGSIIGAQPGFIPADIFSHLLGYIGSGIYKKMEFGMYLKKFADDK